MKVLLLAIILAILLALIGSRYIFVGSYLNLIDWGIAGLCIGYISSHKKNAVINGAIYGFILGFIFIVDGYKGAAPLLSRLLIFVIIGIICALFGAVLSMVGNILKSEIKHK